MDATAPSLELLEKSRLVAVARSLQEQVRQMLQEKADQSSPSVKPAKPSTYKGGRGVLQWVFKTEQLFAAAQMSTDAERLTYAYALMDGPAANWLRGVLTGPGLEGLDVHTTWPEFTAKLIKRFQPLEDEQAARHKLARLVQRKSVRRYVQRFADTVMRIPDMHEADKLFLFKEGLKLANREWVTRSGATTLLTAMAAAEEWEQFHLCEAAHPADTHSWVQPTHLPSLAGPMELGSAHA
jgi:Retrotransposon gag protein